MTQNQKHYPAGIFIIFFLLLMVNLNAQNNNTERDCNCFVCDKYKKSSQDIKKSAIVGSLDLEDLLAGKWNYNLDIFVNDIEITDELEIPKWKSVIDEIHKHGKLFYAHLKPLTHLGKTFEYVMDDLGLQEATTVDVNYNTIQTPWMKERGYKDKSVKMLCGNNPRYRAYLRHQIYMMSQIGVDGIMVDDYTGSPESYGLGGCFCEYCMEGFRDFLKNKYSDEELKELGISNINTFNYRNVVLKYADDVESLKMARNFGEMPLDKDFRYFLFKSDADFFASLKEMACDLSERYIEMGWDNVNFINNRAIYYGYLDGFFTETAYQRMGLTPYFSFAELTTPGIVSVNEFKKQKNDEFIPPEMIYIYKLSDALNKWFVPMPAPPSWGAFKIKNMTGLLRQWIAFSYANGANFKYPTSGWCYGPTSRWYYPAKEEFESVYSFIRNNRNLFDDYKAVEQVGVLYSHATSARNKYISGQLVNLNIPFGTPAAGDEWLANRIKEEDIDPYELMLIPEPYNIPAGQLQTVNNWKAKKPVIYVKDGENIDTILKEKISPMLSMEKGEKIWLFPRYNPENKKAPLICHLINYDYDADRNQNNIQENIKIRLSNKVMEGHNVKDILFYTIDKEPVQADYTIQDENIYITIPGLDLWGIVKVEKK
jgi:hypothetical protein